MGKLITLNRCELFAAATIGARRESQSQAEGHKQKYGADSKGGWERHIAGACAELAFCKGTGRYWSGAFVFRGDDAADGWEVRGTDRKDGCLILHPNDKPGNYALVIRHNWLAYELAGWLPVDEGRNPDYWADPVGGRAAFFVPQKKLREIET